MTTEMNLDPMLKGKADAVVTIASAYLSHNNVALADIATVLNTVETQVTKLYGGDVAPAEPEVKQEPAVPIRRSVTPDFIISLEDGRKLKSLKRYLAAKYNMTPEQYRTKWGLPHDYPMVAPNYSAARSAMARQAGLGLKRQEPVKAATAPKPAPKKASAPKTSANKGASKPANTTKADSTPASNTQEPANTPAS